MANLITILRTFLVFIAVYLLFKLNFIAYMVALVLIIVAFILDGVDGWVARKLNETSKLGSVLDIMSDRIVENTLWVATATLGWLPLVFPIISLTRSFVVDSLRSVALEQGYTAFGETSLQQDKVGYFICSSKFMRITYAALKAIAFVLIILARTPNMEPEIGIYLYVIAYVAAIFAISICLIRGLPVIFESEKLFAKKAE